MIGLYGSSLTFTVHSWYNVPLNFVLSPSLIQSLTRLLESYDSSLSSGKLSEEMCKRYLDTLKTLGQDPHHHDDDALTASSLATELHPSSVELWLRRLSVIVAVDVAGASGVKTRRSKVTRKTGGGVRVDVVCREALDKVPKKVGGLCLDSCVHDTCSRYMYVYL